MPHLPLRALCAALLLAAATAAQAQYAWIGPNGTRQYSDRPPPPGTPASRILKSPGRPAPAPVAEASASDTAPRPAEAKAAPTLAERDAAFRERGKARVEQEQKSQEESQRQRQLAERCAAARETQAQLASGIRIAQVAQNGERSTMSDEERAVRTEKVNRTLQECR